MRHTIWRAVFGCAGSGPLQRWNLGLPTTTTTTTECDGRRRECNEHATGSSTGRRENTCACVRAVSVFPRSRPNRRRRHRRVPAPFATATFTIANPHWSVALSPATVAERFTRNRRPPPSKPTRPYMDSILIVIVFVVVFFRIYPCRKKFSNLL